MPKLVWKTCRKCQARKKSETSFYPDKGNPDGFRSYCRPCGALMMKGYAKAAAAKAKKTPKRAPAKAKAQVKAKAHAKARPKRAVAPKAPAAAAPATAAV